MDEAPDQKRLCPSRVGGDESLIAHWILPDRCQTRQRELYHKCFTCVHRGVQVAGAWSPERKQPEAVVPASG